MCHHSLVSVTVDGEEERAKPLLTLIFDEGHTIDPTTGEPP
jgi:hypothetical protein